LRPAVEPRRVLIVEDSKANAEVLLALLEPLGLEVAVALDGHRGVGLCQELRPDLIWMDIHMPVLDGLEATRRIRALDLDPSPVIVALSASAMAQDRERVIEAGCDDFIAKPFDERMVFSALHRHLGLEWDEGEEDDALERLCPPPRSAEVRRASARMGGLPNGLREALRRATVELDTEAMTAAITAIGDHDPWLGDHLRRLVRGFQFREVLSCIDLAEDRA